MEKREKPRKPPKSGNDVPNPQLSRLGTWIVLASISLMVLLLLGGTLWLAEHPSGAVYKAFIAIAELSIPSERVETDEYLVFLTEDNEANRRQLMNTSPHATFVADSFLPRVVVMKIPEYVEETMAALREKEFVGLVMKYNPSFGCH